MNRTGQNSTQLRQKAEAQLARVPDTKVTKVRPRPARELLHELQVHQIELEMQNEQLRQSQVELEESRDRYVDFYDFSPVGYLTISHDGMIDEINLTGAALLGVERGKLLHRRFAPFVATEDRDRWHLHFLSALKHGNKLSCELALQHGDGSRFYAQLDCLCLKKDGRGSVVRTVLNDITGRKQAEVTLMQYKRVIGSAIDGFWMTDAMGNIQEANEAYAKMLGYPVDELVGMHISQLEAKESSLEEVNAHIAKIIAQGHDRFETRHRHKDGHEIDIEVSATFMPESGRFFVFCHDITGRKKAEEEILHLAFYDTLTRLPNRRLFLDRFCAALPASARYNNYGAVLFIDLDRFKQINDTFGHDYGDLLLVEVAARIKVCVREMDTVARLGGDEFVVLIEGVSDNQEEASHKAGLVAEKIRASLARPYHLNGHEHQSSPSIGISLYRGNEETVEELLQHADMAMYQAKDSGRNAVRFFDPVMQNNVAARAALVNDLRGAVAHRQLHLHYQLQVDNDNRPVGAEALLRWLHPQRGMVMPDDFLPVAEESTLILDIGDWVLETACRQLVSWGGNQKMRDLVLTVNISAKQFAMPDFADQVACALQTHRINPARLKLELTENMALDDLPGAVEKMHALKALGVCLSLDDFGIRYASLSNLKQLPLDQIKLGRSFVQDIASDGNVALLVQSIIDMSGKYRITVIAEGVENEAQLTSLKDRDCVAYQGFLFSKAVPIEEFEALMGGFSVRRLG